MCLVHERQFCFEHSRTRWADVFQSCLGSGRREESDIEWKVVLDARCAGSRADTQREAEAVDG